MYIFSSTPHWYYEPHNSKEFMFAYRFSYNHYTYIWIVVFCGYFFSFYYYFGILYLQKLFTDYLCLSHTNLHNVCNIIYIRCICYIWFLNHHTLKLYITLKKYASRIILCINVISIPNLYIYIERGSKKCRRKCLYVYKYYIPTEKLFCVVEILK